MMKLRVLRTTSFSLLFLVSAVALVHAQVRPAAANEAQSPLSALVRWLDNIGGAHHHRANNSPPLPRPRPAERTSAAVAANQHMPEFAGGLVGSKKKTAAPVQIRD